jgi:tetratricopeptide (TPR) repeat protein
LWPLALAGIFMFFRQGRSSRQNTQKGKNIVLSIIFIASYALSFVIFFVCARYRLPIIPFLIIFASAAGFYFARGLKRKKYGPLLVPGVIFVASYIFFNANLFNVKQHNPGMNYCTLGVAYKNTGNLGKAVVCYKKSIETDPTHAEAYYNLGNIYAQNKQFRIARDLYRRAMKIDPKATRAYNNLGNIYFETGRLDSALKYYGIAIDLDPAYETPLYHSGLIYHELGEFSKAESLWQRLLKINPRNNRVRQLLKTLPKK